MIRGEVVLVPREPGDRADRPRDEEEVGRTAVAAIVGERRRKLGRAARCPRGCRSRATGGTRGSSAGPRPRSLPAGQHSPYVSEPGSSVLSITTSYVPVLEPRRADARDEAEAPVACVVRRAVRDPVGVAPGACAGAVAARRASSSLERARCSSRRGDSTSRKSTTRSPSAPRCTRRGCSTRPAPSSRAPACRSAPRGSRAGCAAPSYAQRLAHAVARDAAADRERARAASACIRSPAVDATGDRSRHRRRRHEVGIRPVALVDHDDVVGPLDPERRVVKRTPRAASGDVRCRDLVRDLGVVGERQEAVRAALRDVQREAVLAPRARRRPSRRTSASPARRSTATSKIAPAVQRTSLASSCGSGLVVHPAQRAAMSG